MSAVRNPVLRRGLRLALAGRYSEALESLSRAGKEPEVINARGVCLLRLGKVDEAIRVYRSLVLMPGCTWMRPELPLIYKTNFATALLLGGSVGGCLEMLIEVQEQEHPSVLRLRSAIKRWERSLTLWQRFNWYCGRLEPRNRPVPIDFAPGEFDPK